MTTVRAKAKQTTQQLFEFVKDVHNERTDDTGDFVMYAINIPDWMIIFAAFVSGTIFGAIIMIGVFT